MVFLLCATYFLKYLTVLRQPLLWPSETAYEGLRSRGQVGCRRVCLEGTWSPSRHGPVDHTHGRTHPGQHGPGQQAEETSCVL